MMVLEILAGYVGINLKEVLSKAKGQYMKEPNILPRNTINNPPKRDI